MSIDQFKGYCTGCGCEPALNVQPLSYFDVKAGPITKNLCEFCRTIPSRSQKEGDGYAIAHVGNILARLLLMGDK